jgi:hypothetical protein
MDIEKEKYIDAYIMYLRQLTGETESEFNDSTGTTYREHGESVWHYYENLRKIITPRQMALDTMSEWIDNEIN